MPTPDTISDFDQFATSITILPSVFIYSKSTPRPPSLVFPFFLFS